MIIVLALNDIIHARASLLASSDNPAALVEFSAEGLAASDCCCAVDALLLTRASMSWSLRSRACQVSANPGELSVNMKSSVDEYTPARSALLPYLVRGGRSRLSSSQQ